MQGPLHLLLSKAVPLLAPCQGQHQVLSVSRAVYIHSCEKIDCGGLSGLSGDKPLRSRALLFWRKEAIPVQPLSPLLPHWVYPEAPLLPLASLCSDVSAWGWRAR